MRSKNVNHNTQMQTSIGREESNDCRNIKPKKRQGPRLKVVTRRTTTEKMPGKVISRRTFTKKRGEGGKPPNER